MVKRIRLHSVLSDVIPDMKDELLLFTNDNVYVGGLSCIFDDGFKMFDLFDTKSFSFNTRKVTHWAIKK